MKKYQIVNEDRLKANEPAYFVSFGSHRVTNYGDKREGKLFDSQEDAQTFLKEEFFDRQTRRIEAL